MENCIKKGYVPGDHRGGSHRKFVNRKGIEIARNLISEGIIQTPKEYDQFIKQFIINFAQPHGKTRRGLGTGTKKYIHEKMEEIETLLKSESYCEVFK